MTEDKADQEWRSITYDQAVAQLDRQDDEDGASVHCFMNPAGMLLGANWSLEDVLACLKASADAGELAEAGPSAKGLGHGVRAVDMHHGKKVIVWFATKELGHVG